MKHLRTVDLPVDELAEPAGNPRRGNVAETVKALKANGQHRSIVAREAGDTYAALVGWEVVEAARRLGWATVRADVIACDDDEAARIMAAEIGTTRRAGYHQGELAALLAAAGDLEGTGYNPAALAALAADPEPATPRRAADTGTRTETTLGGRRIAYDAKDARAFVFEYPLHVFEWAAERFRDLRELTGAATNAEALTGALVLMTGDTAPE